MSSKPGSAKSMSTSAQLCLRPHVVNPTFELCRSRFLGNADALKIPPAGFWNYKSNED